MNTSDFFVAGGTLRLSSESYVVRPADGELFERVQAGEFCYVLTPRQMGKSSLMVKTAERLKQAGHRAVLIDLTGTGTTAVTVDAWYQGLLTRLKMELRLKVEVQAWWEERQASSIAQRFIEFLHQVVLAQVSEPVAIFIDEIDSTLSLGFSDDFFAAIRYIYNERANDPVYKRLTFVLLGVATPSDLIKDQTRTPFNVGYRIDLQEFSRADAQVLAYGLEATYPGYGELILSRIFHWSGGHPYLTQKLCLAAVKAPASTWDEAQVDALVETNFFSDEARNDTNLKFVQSSIQARPEPERRRILQLYQKVYGNQLVRSDERSPIQNYLALFGLVRVAGGRLHGRNEIYRRVFDQTWIKGNMPSNRQQQWAIFASLVAFVLVAITIGVILMRQIPPDIQAQLCRDNFSGATSPAVQMDALACLFKLGPGYDEQARQLFYSLPPFKQKYLFLLDNPQAVGVQVETVVRGIYVTLDQMDGNYDRDLMEAMLKALKEANRPETAELTEEIQRWERGRELADEQQYAQAIEAYSMAIKINRQMNKGEDMHPVVRYDRALAYVELRQYELALKDLEQVMKIAQSSPTPTPTPVQSTPSPTLTSTQLTSVPITTDVTSHEVLGVELDTPRMDGTSPFTSSASPSAKSSRISLAASTPESPPLPDILLSLRFINSGQIIETVGETINQYSDLHTYFETYRKNYPNLDKFTIVPLFYDSFDSNINDWFEGEQDDEYSQTKSEFVDGRYRISQEAKQSVFVWNSQDGRNFKDFMLMVEATPVEHTANFAYGVTVRENSNGDLYAFEIDTDGYYSVSVKVDNEWTTLVDWTKLKAIKPNGTNRLAVQAFGSTFMFLVNDEFATTVEDSSLTNGGIGLALDLYNKGDKASVDFDNLQVLNLSEVQKVAMLDNQVSNGAEDGGAVLFEDTFDSNIQGWVTGEFDDDYSFNTVTVENGQYTISVKDKDQAFVEKLLPSREFDDFVLTVEATPGDSGQHYSYGVSFRENEDDIFYAFEIGNDGQYAVLVFDGEWKRLKDWSTSKAIKMGETNKITIQAEGGHLIFYVNDEKLTTVENDVSLKGKIGLVVAMFEKNTSATVHFDNLLIKKL